MRFTKGLQRILCATDLSARLTAALRRAGSLARQTGARLTLLHVIDTRKQWPLKAVTVRLRHSKIQRPTARTVTRRTASDGIERDVALHGDLTAEQRAQLLEIANKCPVHKTLTSEINIRTRLV